MRMVLATFIILGAAHSGTVVGLTDWLAGGKSGQKFEVQPGKLLQVVTGNRAAQCPGNLAVAKLFPV